ncbi:hypothetical protein ACFWP3_20745 [Streptomyces sp. NPDC058525]|uniref:hypothetical protein n=1 Tax=Streptomyces sp. NPDC058525 TaxID=3346538 RepID=UPI00364CCC31
MCGYQDLAAETNQRRADAVHAAALGLGPRGWAAAAGISESLLGEWRKDPAFDGALTAAAALASAHRVASPGQLNGFQLRLLLRSLARSGRLGAAATSAGITLKQLARIRQNSPQVNSLIEAATLHGRHRRGRRSGSAYRLVHRDAAAGPGPAGPSEKRSP